jgi:hypothetical protein
MSEKPPAGWYPDSNGVTRWWDGEQWTDQQPPPPVEQPPSPDSVFPASSPHSQPSAAAVTTKPKKKRRVFLWFFLIVQVLFIIWIIGGASTGAGTPEDCGSLDAETCNAASDIGTSIGVAMIVVLWVVVDFLLAVIYGVYRLAKRSS